jgi:uncharacterized membrane-anchored protein YjiN (DUF445 family)
VQAYLGSVWDEVRRLLLAEARSPSSGLKQLFVRGIVSTGQGMMADEALRGRLNRWIENFVVKFAVPKRAEIGRFIAEVVRGWDARTVSDRIELAVGGDLQYIRINGTLVGGLVGCLLFLASELLF